MKPRCIICQQTRNLLKNKRTFTTTQRENNIRQWRYVFDECARKKQLTVDDWYSSKPRVVLDEKGYSILKNEFNGSLFNALSTLFPEKKWIPWKFTNDDIPSTTFWKSPSNQLKFFDELGKELKVSHLDDWYEKLDTKLLQQYAPSIPYSTAIAALRTAYPEHEWIPWKFQTTTYAFWNELENQREFFDWLGKKLGVKQLDDWYDVLSRKVVVDNGGSFLPRIYNGSAIDALKACYPEHTWIPWRFKSTSQGFWKSQENHKKFFDWLGIQLGVKQLDDWYNVLSTKVVLDNGGSFLSMYNYSVTEALKTCYPQHNWVPWKFKHTTHKFWNNLEHHRQFFDWLGKELGVKELDDWYELSNLKTIVSKGGTFVIEKYNGSPIEALKACYPEHNWIPWKFTTAPQKFWKSKDNQKQFFEWLGKQLGVQQWEDWYKLLTVDAVMENGGTGFVHQYSSVIGALISCYPEHKWDISKFEKCKTPKKYWDSEENLFKLLSELSEKLSIHTLDDWYRVDLIQLQRFGIAHVIQRHGGLFRALSLMYPNHPWNPMKFRTQKKAQRWLIVNLAKIYPNEEILEDYIHPDFETQRPLQLDAFMPGLSLAFEYQGQQHFQDIHVFQSKRMYLDRDQQKRIMCAKHNITLIEVPYWWDRTTRGLQKIIEEHSVAEITAHLPRNSRT